MTQTDKELLLNDLCGRLPYGVKVKFCDSKPALLTVIEHDEFGWRIGSEDEFGGMITIIDNVKPYLFPLSSMTKAQKKEYNNLCETILDDFGHPASFDTVDSLDWLNENHFDYRGLIPMGLAIDATNLNIY